MAAADDARPRRRRAPAGHASASGPALVSPNALVASAEMLKAKKGAVPRPESWQEEAWGYFDTTPELRFACAWYAAALSRGRLTLARRGAPGDDPTPLEPGDAVLGLLDDLGSQQGQSQLLSAFAPHLVVPGLAVLAGVDEEVDATTGEVLRRSWTILGSDDLRVVSKPDGTEGWEAKNEAGVWGPLADDMLPVKIIRRHPRDRTKADSPVRALLPILRELHLLTEHVEAAATSRLAGNGVFAIPSEASMPVSKEAAKTSDPFLAEFIDAMMTPIGDRAAASAVVPLLLRVPGEFLALVKHITFSTPFDEAALKLREEARVRFAAGMDMPAEILLGLGDSNHWTAWQIDESAIKLHIVPMFETIVEGLDVGWLAPTLAAAVAAGTPGIAGRDDLDDIVVWYDLSKLTVRPDRSGDAKELYALGLVGPKTVLRECGFDLEADGITPDEFTRWLLVRAVEADPTLAPVVLSALGMPVNIPTDVTPFPSGAPAPGAPPAGDAPAGPDVTPPTQAAPPPPPDAGVDAVAASLGLANAAAVADAAADAAMLTAADAAVARALERAGSKLRNLARRNPDATASIDGVDAALVHTVLDATCYSDLDKLLEGAWSPLEAVAARYEVDPAPIVDIVDRYARALLAARTAHEYSGLREALDRQPAPA